MPAPAWKGFQEVVIFKPRMNRKKPTGIGVLLAEGTARGEAYRQKVVHCLMEKVIAAKYA